MNKFLVLVFLFIVFSCNKAQKEETKLEDLIMVKQSEMAALMLSMYGVNQANKSLILKGEKPKHFPNQFFNIHTANLTEPSDRNEAFKAYSDFYLKNLQALYNTTDIDSLITKHNNVINSCITCHKTTCVGPIPKIKKLLIQ